MLNIGSQPFSCADKGEVENDTPLRDGINSGPVKVEAQKMLDAKKSSPCLNSDIKERSLCVNKSTELLKNESFKVIWEIIFNSFSKLGLKIIRERSRITIPELVLNHEAVGFYKQVSEPLTALVESGSLGTEDKLSVLNSIINEVTDHKEFTAEQKKLVTLLVEDAKVYQSMQADLNELLGYSQNNNDFLLHKLFIERYRAIGENDKELGAFVFENECSYLTKTCASFFYLWNCVVQGQNINYSDLRVAASILYSEPRFINTQQFPLTVNKFLI